MSKKWREELKKEISSKLTDPSKFKFINKIPPKKVDWNLRPGDFVKCRLDDKEYCGTVITVFPQHDLFYKENGEVERMGDAVYLLIFDGNTVVTSEYKIIEKRKGYSVDKRIVGSVFFNGLELYDHQLFQKVMRIRKVKKNKYVFNNKMSAVKTFIRYCVYNLNYQIPHTCLNHLWIEKNFKYCPGITILGNGNIIVKKDKFIKWINRNINNLFFSHLEYVNRQKLGMMLLNQNSILF